MKSSLLIGAGALITVAGIIFALQGLGYIGGSAMTGVTFWAVAGPLIALAGHHDGCVRPAAPALGFVALHPRGHAVATGVCRAGAQAS